MAISRKISSKTYVKQSTSQDLALGNLVNVNNQITIDRFSGDNTTTTFTLSSSPIIANTLVFISGVEQFHNTYIISGNQIIFSAAPPTGTGNIEVLSGTALGSSSSSGALGGLKNYLTTYDGNPGNGNFESGTTAGWKLFTAILSGVIPTNGGNSAGAASFTTFATTTSNPLAQTTSLQTTGTYTAGQGFWSDTFTIDSEDQAKAMAFKYYYKVNSGATNGNFSGTSSNTFATYIWDVTNSAWIQPAGVYNTVQSSGAGIATGTFQTSANGTQYRLAVICINTPSGSLDMLWDDFFLGPQITAAGAAISDWETWTPTGSWVSNTTYSGFKRRVGANLECIVKLALTGAPTSTALTINLPSGLSINESQLPNIETIIGRGRGNDNSAGVVYLADARTVVGSPTLIGVISETVNQTYNFTSPWNGTTPTTWATADDLTITFSVPVVGWSSNTVMSNDTDTRVVAMKATTASNLAVTGSTAINFTNIDFDTNGAITTGAGTWRYTAPVSGIYTVSMNGFLTSGAAGILFYKNGVNQGYIGNFTTNASCAAGSIKLNAGDYVDFRPDGSVTFSTATANIQRLSGPATIAATDTVAASYWLSANFSASTTIPINFDSKEFDTTNSVTTSATAWKFTAPVSGTYSVGIYTESTSTTTMFVYKNGVAYKPMSYTISSSNGIGGSTLIRLVAGDYIDIRPGGAVTMNGGSLAAANTCNVNILRVGN